MLDDVCVLPLTPQARMAAKQMRLDAGTCAGRDAETRNNINVGTEAQALATDRRDDV
jgi:hypothetical protein